MTEFEEILDALTEEDGDLANMRDSMIASSEDFANEKEWQEAITKSCTDGGECKWPGTDNAISDDFKARYLEDGVLTEWMRGIKLDSDAKFSFPSSAKTRFSLDDIREMAFGQNPQTAQQFGQNPFINGTASTKSVFEDLEVSPEAIRDFHRTGFLQCADCPDKDVFGRSGYKKTTIEKISRSNMVNSDDPMSWYDEKTNRVEYKKNFIGKINGTSFYGNNQLALLNIMGVVDQDGEIILAQGLTGNAQALAEELQEQVETRFNKGETLITKDGVSQWESDCIKGTDVCAGARGTFTTMADQWNTAVTEVDGGNPFGPKFPKIQENAQAIADIQKGWSGINSATGEENGITGADIAAKATSKSNTWWGKFKGMFEKDDLPGAIETYNKAFNKALKKYGGGKWAKLKPEAVRNRFTSRQDLLGPMFRDKKMLDKITAGLAAGNEDMSRAIQILKNNDMSLHSYYEASEGPQGVIIGSLEDAKTLEKIFSEMKGSDAWGKIGDGKPPITQNDLDEVMKKWRTTHGLPDEEGWYKEENGKWQCSGGATITHCAGAPKTLEDALNDMLDDGESEGVNKIGEKGSKLLKFLKFFGKYFFYASLLDLLLSHSEAMSGCFLVPLEVRDSNGKVIPSYSNTSYKINALTCKQEMKTWGSGYLLGIPFGKDDWFGSAVFGSSPNSKGGNVQAAPTCLRGGKCDGLSLPTPNFFNCHLPTPGPGGKFEWNQDCPPSPCVKNPTSDCHMNPGPGNYLTCFPNSNYKSSGGQTYIYDPQRRTCTEHEEANLYGHQWVNGSNGGTRAADGCNFKCGETSNAENFEYAATASPSPSPSPSCSSTTGAGPCGPGEVCEAESGRCIPRTQTCLPMGMDQIASPSGSLSQGAAYWQDQSNYCVGGGGGTSGWGINDTTCNPTQDGPLVNCDTNYNQPIYSNCKVGGVNFATGKSPDSIFNGYCASQSYQTHTWPSPHFWDIDGLEFNHDTDAPMPLCFNNPDYANPGFNSSTYEITLNPHAQFAENSPHEAKSGTYLTYLTCVKPQEYIESGNTICQTDDDCNDGSEGNKLQICVGSSGGIMPGKGSSSPNTNPGFCVNVQPAPSCKPSPSQPCFKDSRGNSYHGQCVKNTGVNLQGCNSLFPPSQGLEDNTLPQICVNPGISDMSKAKGGEKLGTRGACLSVGPNAVRNHMGANATDPDPCSEDTADTCSQFCNSYGPDAPQVPPGFTLSCQNVGILGAAADWLERAVNVPDLGDPFGGFVHVLMWIGIALGIGIVILGILSMFMRRVDKTLFGWMG